MNIENRLAMSYYEEIAILNKQHNISLVQHRSSHKIYVKKELAVYNIDVFEHLRNNPISHMPKIYEMYEENGILTIIEEYISGDTLEEILNGQSPLPQEDALSLFFQLCGIVSCLHKSQPPIIHRDIKPSNIIITPSKTLYLLDMNAGKFVSRDKDEDTKLLGTRGYAAPEQYGFGSSDEHTDIYALGIILDQLLSGNPNPLEPVIKKCTMMEASQRYHSVDDLVSSIKKIARIRDKKYPSMFLYKGNPFFPPGFRTGNHIHVLSAIPFYVILLIMGLTLKVENGSVIFERFCFVFAGLYLIGVTCNYLNIQKKLPFCDQENIYLRTLAILAYDIIGFLAVVVIMVVIEYILHLL